MSYRRIVAFLAISAAGALFWAAGCSGGAKKGSLEEMLLDYEEYKAVSFTISGDAKCRTCLEDDIPVMGMQITVWPADDPTREITTRMFDGLGPFTIEGVHAEPGAAIELSATLFREGSSGTISIGGFAKVTAPEDDGGVVSVILQFPSRDEGEE